MSWLTLVNALTGARELSGLRRKLRNEVVFGLGGELSRALDGVSDRRIEQLLATPARRVLLDAMFWGAPAVLERTAAGEVASSLRCQVTGATDGGYDVYWLEYTASGWRSGRGDQPTPPELTLTVDDAELLRLACGRSSVVQAFLAGKLRASGNPMLAARLAALALR